VHVRYALQELRGGAVCLGVGFGKFRSFGFGVSEFRTISDFGWYISEFRFRSFGVLVVRGSALYVYTELRAPWLVLGCKN